MKSTNIEYIPQVGDWIEILETGGNICGCHKGDIKQIKSIDGKWNGTGRVDATFTDGAKMALKDNNNIFGKEYYYERNYKKHFETYEIF